MKKKKKHPIKYLKYKGRFGHPINFRSERPDDIVFEGYLGVYNEDAFEKMINAFNAALENSDRVLDMRQIKGISIDGGLLLKAFYEEYQIKHRQKPQIKGPQDKKMRAVLNYLEIANYQDVKNLHFPDIECWKILSWDDASSTDIHIGKMLSEDIIPNFWKGKHTLSANSADIATSVSEAFYNCKEHAYTGGKEFSYFKRWYLGVGDYPNSNKFSFNIYDKGVGIKERLKAKPDGWLDKASDWLKSDSGMIELATKGKRGATEGRGKGLKFAIEQLTKNNGEIDIYSEHGYFSTNDRKSGIDRYPRLEGTLVSFSFPVEYIEVED